MPRSRCRDPAPRRAWRRARGVRSPAGAAHAQGAPPMTYRLIALLALLALIVGIVLLSGPQRESVAPASAGEPLHDPGYSATNARLIQTGADGRPVYTLDAAQIQQQPNDGLVQLQQVQLGFRDASGNQWTARAARGQLAQNSGVVKLDGDVHVEGTLPGSNDAAEITSEHLSFD